MWEFCVFASKENQHLLTKLSENLKQDILNFHGVQTVVLSDQNCVLVIALKEKNLTVFKRKLKLALTNLICRQMKFDFLKSHLFFANFNDIFLKVFTYFDLELEQAMVLKLMNFSNTLNLESFLEFRLSFLKNKWKELCNLALSNEKILQKETHLKELLKFLLENLETKTNILVLDFKSNDIFDEKENFSKRISKLGDDALKTLEIVLENFPKHLKIIKNFKNTKQQNFFVELFDKNIEFF